MNSHTHQLQENCVCYSEIHVTTKKVEKIAKKIGPNVNFFVENHTGYRKKFFSEVKKTEKNEPINKKTDAKSAKTALFYQSIVYLHYIMAYFRVQKARDPIRVA